VTGGVLWRYLAARAGQAVLLLLAIASVTFFLVSHAPGDFLSDARLNPQVTARQLQALEAQYALDRPLPERYAAWLRSAWRGEGGYSMAYHMPVSTLLWPRAGRTLRLTGAALVLAWLLAIPLGVWGARRRDGLLDRGLGAATSVLQTIPDLIAATLVLVVSVRLGWLGTEGILLPLLTLTALGFPPLYRHARAALLDAAGAPYIAAARPLGIPEARLWFRHILPAAANPLISLFGLSVAGLLSSSLLVEVVFGWPGMGPLFLEAVAARDVQLVAGAVVLSSAMLIAGNLLTDVLLLIVDPRPRRRPA
jgi:peptide/nickel transport system permease protein